MAASPLHPHRPGHRARSVVPALLLLASVLPAQTLEIAPARVPIDQAAALHATGLGPNERVTIQAELTDGDDVRWRSHADFTANAQGTIDDTPTALIWSMTPESGKPGRYTPPKNFHPQTIEFRLKSATAHLEQLPIAEGVQQIVVHEGSLRRAAWFASHGYVALALAYFRYEDLPPQLSGIPLEYFGRALNWMAHRPDIDPDRIGVEGVSRGAELALQLGSMYPIVKTVIAYSPSNVRNPACCGFTPVPYALLISGDADRIWESSSMADSVVHRLEDKHFAFAVEHLKYPHAGHGVGRPEIVPAWVGAVANPTSGRQVEPGGTPRGNAESTLDAIPKVLAFLRQQLATRTAGQTGADSPPGQKR
jgi:dienelactone hydrolase